MPAITTGLQVIIASLFTKPIPMQAYKAGELSSLFGVQEDAPAAIASTTASEADNIVPQSVNVTAVTSLVRLDQPRLPRTHGQDPENDESDKSGDEDDESIENTRKNAKHNPADDVRNCRTLFVGNVPVSTKRKVLH